MPLLLLVSAIHMVFTRVLSGPLRLLSVCYRTASCRGTPAAVQVLAPKIMPSRAAFLLIAAWSDMMLFVLLLLLRVSE